MLAEDFYPRKSGGAFIDWNVAKHLVECGDQVTVVTPRVNSLPAEETAEGVNIRRPFSGRSEDIPPNSIRGQVYRVVYALLVFPYLLRLIWSQNFDVIYSTNHLYHPIAATLKVIFRLPLVTFVGYSPSIHDDVSLTDPLVLIERMNFRFFMGNRALCRTPSILEILSKRTGGRAFRVDGIVDPKAIDTAVSTAKSPKTGFSNEDIQLVFVGRLTELKQAHRLPSLISQLPSNYSLLIVGDGPQHNRIEREIKNAEVNDRVQLSGRLPHKQALRAIYESDILVLPSKADAYPAVVFEALSLNTHVVGTPVGVLPTIDHAKLTVEPFSRFSEIIPAIDVDSQNGIDEQSLREYSVQQFASSVREHLVDSHSENQ